MNELQKAKEEIEKELSKELVEKLSQLSLALQNNTVSVGLLKKYGNNVQKIIDDIHIKIIRKAIDLALKKNLSLKRNVHERNNCVKCHRKRDTLNLCIYCMKALKKEGIEIGKWKWTEHLCNECKECENIVKGDIKFIKQIRKEERERIVKIIRKWGKEYEKIVKEHKRKEDNDEPCMCIDFWNDLGLLEEELLKELDGK